MKERQKFTLAAIYDTETTNVYSGVNSRAFPCLFIVNDIRGVNIEEYTTGRDDNIKLLRYETEMQDYIDDLVEWGKSTERVPIICAYNLMFDMQPLMEELAAKYKMKACAQSSTHVYTLDLLDNDGKILLRFWDTFYLEMRGLAAMGETCGLEKAKGDWDYTLKRTSETYLTKEEIHYASRDVQVIPAYLKYLMQSNDWLQQLDFGVTVLTKTSLVRQMAKKKIGKLRYLKTNMKKITQEMMFNKLCMQELPKTFHSYGLRKACFRGGLTFTSAKYAAVVVDNVASLDVTSMHHLFINGRYIPTNFKEASISKLEEAYDYIINAVSVTDVLERYEKPFTMAFHMKIRLDNIRLKKGSCFDEWGIATIPSAKFTKKAPRLIEEDANDEANIQAENLNRINGWKDTCKNPTFAFGKLYKADSITIHLTEVELWAINRVYEWDGHECILGELTTKFTRPPDYVTLQSNLLFGMKTDMKTILKNYTKGERYQLEIPDTIPPNLALNISAGAIDKSFLESYYGSTVKGQFNGIYGTMAQDIYKPDFEVDNEGHLCIDKKTELCADNFDEKQPKWCKVLYTYGMRIVGGSRLHLILAMELLYKKFKDKIRITGGDTDSIKASLHDSITDDDLLQALTPLHNAATWAIDNTMDRIREEYPEMASTLNDIGCFEVERCGNSTRYAKHMEAWNKARISLDDSGKVHVTCAGLSRPSNMYNVERFIEDMLEDYEPEQIFPLVLGFNEFVQPCLAFSLETHHPDTMDIFDDYVMD